MVQDAKIIAEEGGLADDFDLSAVPQVCTGGIGKDGR